MVYRICFGLIFLTAVLAPAYYEWGTWSQVTAATAGLCLANLLGFVEGLWDREPNREISSQRL